MLSFKHMIKRLPFALLIWAIGAVTCVVVFYFTKENAAAMPSSGFTWLTTYVPYIVMVVCTIVVLLGSEKSFASLIWCIVFSLALGIACMIVAGTWQQDPQVVAALLINSPEGTEVKPVTSDPMHVGIRFFMALLLPVVTASIMTWNDKRKNKTKKTKKTKASKSTKKSSKGGK